LVGRLDYPQVLAGLLELAHGGHAHGNTAPLAAIAIAAMVIPLVVLGFIGRAFWRSSKRDEAERSG
jgi:hypothetical protein